MRRLIISAVFCSEEPRLERCVFPDTAGIFKIPHAGRKVADTQSWHWQLAEGGTQKRTRKQSLPGFMSAKRRKTSSTLQPQPCPSSHPLTGTAGSPGGHPSTSSRPGCLRTHPQCQENPSQGRSIEWKKDSRGNEDKQLELLCSYCTFKKEQALLLKAGGETKNPITHKAGTSYPSGCTAAHPLPSPRAHRGSRGTRGSSWQRAQATEAKSALTESGFPGLVTPSVGLASATLQGEPRCQGHGDTGSQLGLHKAGPFPDTGHLLCNF